jgi:hypothetical protein
VVLSCKGGNKVLTLLKVGKFSTFVRSTAVRFKDFCNVSGVILGIRNPRSSSLVLSPHI